MKTRRARGFTLVELMVVATIVAVLASVAIPLMSMSKKKSMATECEAGLGTLRRALRAMFAETRSYAVNPDGQQIEAGPVTVIPGVGAADLNGTFFRTGDYSIESIDAASFSLMCEGSSGEVQGVVIRLNHQGVFNRTGL